VISKEKKIKVQDDGIQQENYNLISRRDGIVVAVVVVV